MDKVEPIIINSAASLLVAFGKLKALFAEFKYITLSIRIGADRSLDQNALFHVWLTEYCAHLAKIDKRDVSKPMVEYLKRKAKKDFYLETGSEWMVESYIDPATGEEGSNYFRSSADYKRGEMFVFLTWLQMRAANDNLILESRGEFNKLQREAA